MNVMASVFLLIASITETENGKPKTQIDARRMNLRVPQDKSYGHVDKIALQGVLDGVAMIFIFYMAYRKTKGEFWLPS